MHIIMMFCLFVFATCSISNLSDHRGERLSNLDSERPFFDIHLDGFVVFNEGPDLPSPTPSEEENSRKLTVSEKRRVLDTLDRVRFVVNTPEFAELMLAQEYYVNGNFIGPKGMISIGEKYDPMRLLQLIRDRSASVIIRKEQMPLNVLGIGQLPQQPNGRPFNAYVASEDDALNFSTFFIGINNVSPWDSPMLGTDAFLANLVFHELIHNMGFTHRSDLNVNDPSDLQKDTVYLLGEVMEVLYDNAAFQQKYAVELGNYDLYPEVYSFWLNGDTVPNAHLAHSEVRQEGPSINMEELKSELKNAMIYRTSSGVELQCIYDEIIRSFITVVIDKKAI